MSFPALYFLIYVALSVHLLHTHKVSIPKLSFFWASDKAQNLVFFLVCYFASYKPRFSTPSIGFCGAFFTQNGLLFLQ